MQILPPTSSKARWPMSEPDTTQRDEHGTTARAQRHIREGSSVCELCREAKLAYERERRRERRRTSQRGVTEVDQRRFWAKVQVPTTADGCMEWTGYRDPFGYGRFGVGPRNYKAHRLSYELLVAPIPDYTEIDHLCRNTSCVRPDHLDAVDHQENMSRGDIANRRKMHCPEGHPYSGANLYLSPNGRRECRACRDRRGRERRAANR